MILIVEPQSDMTAKEVKLYQSGSASQSSTTPRPIQVVWVPDSFEIGVVAEKLGKSRKYQAILCIGAVNYCSFLRT
ncbi:hypothetical protein LOK49_LG04G01062 [Camellia lanceoleosa]|uniref:Uncharacterized protein n=1 Tax=Camellia lanceoleosa TaxID=1840588 RepID=A0ACC0HXF3_9ERIC|nr:hypothetical protein LOK49_LG04G01062 [Camellia lanceoleosa]